MQGMLLDRVTGKPEGYSHIPRSHEVDDWSKRVEREVALSRSRQLLELAERDGPKNTTTTNRYLSFPAAAVGISRASSGSTAWSFSAYTEVVPVNTITATYYIAAIILQPPAATATALTNEYIIEFATGLAGSEVTIIQVPFTVRNVTAAGYIPAEFITLPEPKQVAANTRISTRFAYSVATTSVTVNGIKILYETV